MSKNKQSAIYAVANALLALFAQQLASGVYPIPEPWPSVIGGVAALAIAAMTALSPFFSIRQATK